MKKVANIVQKSSFPVIFPDTPVLQHDSVVTSLPKNEITALHYHNLCEVGICRCGNGLWVVEDNVTAINGGDIMIVPAGVHHYSRAISSCCCEFIYFDSEKLLADCGINIGISLPCGLHSVVSSELRPLLRAMLEARDKKEAALWYALFLTKLGDGEREPQKIDHGKLSAAIHLITTSYSSELNNDILAAECGFSKSWFIKEFKREYSVSPIEFLNNFRVKVAAELLKGDLSITEIAERSGFGSPSDLYRNFKKIKKCSPSEYRKETER